MAQDITKGHIKLDGQEYLIDERSYTVTETPDLAQRISSGTPGYQDHLIFKNDAQSLWSGGYDFKFLDDFTNPTTFLESSNIDIFRKVGEFKLSRRLDEPSITLLAAGAKYITNTKAGFDAGTYTQAASTDTPDIRVGFDSSTAVYTVKEAFDGGGIDAEFSTAGTSGDSTVTESGGFAIMRSKPDGSNAIMRGTTTTIKGFKVNTLRKGGGSYTGSFQHHVGMTDTAFSLHQARTGNYIIFAMEYEPNPSNLRIIVGGSSYGAFEKVIGSFTSGNVEAKEVNGSQIEIYVDSVLQHTVNAGVAADTKFQAVAFQNFASIGRTLEFDTVSYWDYGYYSTGNWRSAQYTNTGGSGDNIVQLILKHNALSATEYIDKIEILDASDNSVVSTRTTNITAGASSTFTGLTAGGWDTAWADAALDDLDIKVKPYFVTAGAQVTPKITEAQVTFSAVGAVEPIDGLITWNSDLWLWGDKQVWKSTDGATWTNQATAASTINDAEAFKGRLYFAEPGRGYEFTATGSALTADTSFSADYLKSNTAGASSGRLYGVDANALAYSDYPHVGGWVTAFTHSSGEGETYFLGKPEVHNRFIYYSVNRGDTDNGPGSIWIYDHNNGTSLLIAQEEVPVTKKIKSAFGKLFYATREKTKLIIKAIDGGAIRTIKRIELSDAQFEDVEWIEQEGKLNFIPKSSSVSAHQYQYDPAFDQGNGEGVVRLRTLSNANANGVYKLGILDRELYIGDDDGQIKKVSTSYHTEGTLTSGHFDAGQFKTKKKYVEMEIHHDALPSDTSIDVSYKLDDNTSFTSAEGAQSTPDATSFIAKIPTSNNVGNKLDYKITLNSPEGTSTPTVRDVIVKYQFIEPYRRQWQFGVIITDSIEYLDGSREQKGASELLGSLQNTRASTDIGTIDFYDIDQSLHKIDYMRFGAEVPRVVGEEMKQDYIVGVQLIETRESS